MAPSASHRNRCAHNWLLYRLIDKWLLRSTACFRGVVVDLGAGSAPYRNWFESRCDRYVTVDWHNSLHAGRPDVLADLNSPIPLARESADCIVSVAVLEHLRQPQVMLNKAARMLRPGGFILLHVPFQWWVHEAPHDYFRYTPYALRFMFQTAGFTDVMIEPAGGIATQFALKANYLLRRLVRGPRYLRAAIGLALLPVWHAFQFGAIVFDRLDRSPDLETVGYFVTAQRPQSVAC